MDIMKLLICSFFLFGYFFLPSFGYCKDFQWPMFLPAITSIGSELNCGNVAGCYEGFFTDNCSGTSVSGRINLTIREDCSFNSFSNYGVQSRGTITNRRGSTYSGPGQTDSNGCGAFNISCSGSGSTLSCNYTYNNGKVGSIPNVTSGACKPINRLKTEMLAGYWRFTYQIISSYNSYYYLDIKYVEKSTSISGEYDIFGNDEYGGLVIGGYDTTYNDYSLYDQGSIIDRFYVFNFAGGGVVNGCYYQINNSDGSWSNCYPMSGVLLSLTKNVSATKSKIEFNKNVKESQEEQEVNTLESHKTKMKFNKINPSIRKSYERLKALYSNKKNDLVNHTEQTHSR